LVALVVIILVVFYADINLPLGIAGGVPYAAAVLVAIKMGDKKLVIIVTVICTLLTALGFFLSPSGGELWKVLSNRFLAVLVIWTSMYLGLQIKATKDELDLSVNEYKDLFNQQKDNL